jgi:PAS domain S-box-containing protein
MHLSFRFRNYLLKTTPRNLRKGLLILLISLSVSLVRVYYLRQYVEKHENQISNSECNDISGKINALLHSRAQLLRSSAALFASTDTVTREAWRRFLEVTNVNENIYGVKGVSYVPVIAEAQLQHHIKTIQQEGFPNYRVKPAGKRAVYCPIVYIEPFSGLNMQAFGYDIFSEPVRRKAIEHARDENLVSLSGKITLVQQSESDSQAGLLFLAPVYKESMPIRTVEQRRLAFKGVISISLQMDNLLNGIVDSKQFNKDNLIELEVYDDSISSSNLLFDSLKDLPKNKTNSQSLTLIKAIDYNGKKWMLKFTKFCPPVYAGYSIVYNSLAFGLLLSILIFGLALTFFNINFRARQIAEALTLELKESKERFLILLNSAAEGIYGLDLAGNCTFANQSSLQMLGYNSEDELLGKNMHLLIHYAKSDGSIFDITDCPIHQSLNQHLKTHEESEIFLRADGTFFPVEYWSYPIIANEIIEGVVVTFIDISDRKREELALRNSEQKFRVLFEQVPLPLFIFDGKGKISYLNHRFTEILGYSEHEITSREDFGMIAFPTIDNREVEQKRWEKQVNNALEAGIDMQPEEYQIICKDKEVRPFMIYGVPFNQNFLVIFIDLTQIRNAEEQIKKLSLAIEHSPVVVEITDINGNIEYVNPAFTTITGYQAHEVLGKNPRFLKSERAKSTDYSKLWSTISSGNTWHGEFINLKKNGEEFIEQASISPIWDSDQKIVSYIAIKEDITELKRLESRIVNQNAELAALNATKDKFFSIIAHDLRNPFTSILGFSELLVKNLNKLSEDKILKYANAIHSTGQNAFKLLENLLVWTKTQTGMVLFQPQEFILEHLLIEVVKLMENGAMAKQILLNYEISEPYIVRADWNMVLTVMRNLVSNALKFTNRQGSVVIKATQIGDKVEISVADNGIGISEENQKTLFEISERKNTAGTEKEGGSGLGLLICHEFISKHKEDIHVKSEVGKGSEFSFALPLITPNRTSDLG